MEIMITSGKQAGSTIEWIYDDSSRSLKISGAGCMGDVLMSEEYQDEDNKKRSRTIRESPWDEYAEHVEFLEVESNVVSIAPAAFINFTKLKEAHLPGAIIIGSGAFYLCRNLEAVQMPNVCTIGNGAFEHCESLEKMLVWREDKKRSGYIKRTKFTMKRTMSIGNYAFKDAKKLRSLSMEQCESIGKYAFYGCESLVEARFRAATQVGEGAFYGCGKLELAQVLQGSTIGDKSLYKAGIDKFDFVEEENE